MNKKMITKQEVSPMANEEICLPSNEECKKTNYY